MGLFFPPDFTAIVAKELKRKQEQARNMKRLAEERERRLKREEEERLAFLREQEREQVEVRIPSLLQLVGQETHAATCVGQENQSATCAPVLPPQSRKYKYKVFEQRKKENVEAARKQKEEIREKMRSGRLREHVHSCLLQMKITINEYCALAQARGGNASAGDGRKTQRQSQAEGGSQDCTRGATYCHAVLKAHMFEKDMTTVLNILTTDQPFPSCRNTSSDRPRRTARRRTPQRRKQCS